MAWITDPTAWLGLGTLVVMELVLGIDNLIFIAILSGRLPARQRNRAVTTGLSLALLTRLALLSGISWLQSLTTPVFAIRGFAFSPRDLALIVGGLFLLSKGTIELHGRLEPAPAATIQAGSSATFWQVIAQIVVLDAVFSLDSVITAVGMVDELAVMMIAVVAAVAVMMWTSRPLTEFVSAHPTVVILCLSFLLMIGLSLVLDGFGLHVPKGYIYAAIVFSVAVEFLNQTARRNLTRYAAAGNLRARTAEAVLRILGGGHEGGSVTEDLAPLVAARRAGGIFTPEERSMMAGVMSLAERPVRAIMTPSNEVAWLDLNNDPASLRRYILETGHEAYPVCRGDLDNLVGVARAPDLVRDILEKGRIDEGSLDPKPLIVHEDEPVLRVIEQVRRSPVRIAIATDEFGVIRGVVTSTDILEAIIGDGHEDDDDWKPQPDGSVLVRAGMDMRRFRRRSGIHLGEGAERHATLAGYLLSRMGRLPDAGETLAIGDVCIEIVGTRGRRIDVVRITKRKTSEGQ